MGSGTIGNSGSTGDQFSLKARRTTRIPLRIPIQLVVQGEARARTLDAWTTIVNIHGARIECKVGLALQQEVVINVPFNGMSQKGCVVWNRKEQNERGNFEFAVELDRPENLWGVGFPPSDWDSVKANGNGAAGAAPKSPERSAKTPAQPQPPAPQTPPPIMLTDDNVQPQASEPGNPIIEAGDSAEPAMDVAPMQFEIERHDPSLVDLSAEFSTLAEQKPPSKPQLREPAVSRPTFEESIEMLITAQLENPAPTPAAAEMTPVHTAPGSGNPTDRLSAFFQELVETALSDRVKGVVQRMGERMELRVQQIEADALARAEQRIQAAADSHSSAMERRAADFVGSQQVALEQSVQQFLHAAEEGTLQRQQQFLEQSQQTLNDQAAALLDSSKSRLEQQAADLTSVTQQALRFSIEQQLPAIERDLLERCRTEAERLMAGQVEQWTLLFKDRTEQARQSALTELESAASEAAKRHISFLDEHAEQGLQQAGARLEQQLARIGTQIRQSFLRHIVGELSRSQQIWIQQAQREMETLAAQNLQWTRQSIAQIMKNFGESLIRQAYLEGGTPPEVKKVTSESDVTGQADETAAEWNANGSVTEQATTSSTNQETGDASKHSPEQPAGAADSQADAATAQSTTEDHPHDIVNSHQS
jgi:hypothetical protein